MSYRGWGRIELARLQLAASRTPEVRGSAQPKALRRLTACSEIDAEPSFPFVIPLRAPPRSHGS